jgi:hypothetical protein
MPITSTVHEHKEGRRGSVDSTYQGTYTRSFQVIFSDRYAGPIRARAAVGIGIGDVYRIGVDGVDDFFEEDTGAFCNEISAEQETGPEADGKQWTVTVQYGPYEPASDNPLAEPAQVEVDHDHFDRPVIRDVDGNLICNSAGDPYNPPIRKDDSRPVLTVVKNYPAPFDLALADDYRDTINSTPFFGVPPGRVKCRAPRASRQFHPVIGEFYRVTFQFDFNRDGWNAKPLDEGFRYLSGAQLVAAFDGNSLASEPVLLDGEGGRLAVGGDPVYHDFQIYEGRDFASAFGFGS